MRNRIGILLGIALGLPAVAGLALDAQAGPRKLRPEVRALLEAPTFSDAGDFSGALERSIVVNGTRYWLAQDVQVYEIGRGMIPAGTVLSLRRVSLSGVSRGDVKVVHQIIVRPESDVSMIGSGGNDTGVLEDDAGPR